MKKCSVCNRTFADEFSFCLEDGSLLSAPFNLHNEQETIFRPNKTAPAPTEYFPVATDNYNERPTVISAKNTNLTSAQTTKKPTNIPLIILCVILGTFAPVAAYTGSIIPLIVGLIISLIYLLVRQIIKKI